MAKKTKALKEIKATLLKNKAVRAAYDDMELEFAIAHAVIEARQRSGLTQSALAKRMGTSQSYIARLESGTALPTMETLKRVAIATDTLPRFELVAA
jgi:ribosome-binding protein aMBF1 (putative translation factor)